MRKKWRPFKVMVRLAVTMVYTRTHLAIELKIAGVSLEEVVGCPSECGASVVQLPCKEGVIGGEWNN